MFAPQASWGLSSVPPHMSKILAWQLVIAVLEELAEVETGGFLELGLILN